MALKQNGGAHLSSDIDFIATPKAPADTLSTGKSPGVRLTNVSQSTVPCIIQQLVIWAPGVIVPRHQKPSTASRRPRIRTMVKPLPRRVPNWCSPMAVLETRRRLQDCSISCHIYHPAHLNRDMDCHVQLQSTYQSRCAITRSAS